MRRTCSFLYYMCGLVGFSPKTGVLLQEVGNVILYNIALV